MFADTFIPASSPTIGGPPVFSSLDWLIIGALLIAFAALGLFLQARGRAS